MEQIVIRGNEIHIWQARLTRSSEELAEMRPLLSPDEIQRADRFVFERDRTRFTVARAILRLILESYEKISARNLRFAYSAAGKPSLMNGSSVSFNLSHSGDLVVYAFATGNAIGIDLEKINPEIDCQELAGRFFSTQENTALNSIPVESRIEAFFRCWTRKEAYVKALGDGLSLPLNHFSVSVLSDEPPFVTGKPDWVVHDLTVHPEYAAAVVVAAPVSEFKLFHFSSNISTESRGTTQKLIDE